MAVNKVSNNVSCDDVNKSEIFFFKNIGDILCNSNSDNKSRKLVGVSNGVMISIDELEKEWRDNLKGEQGANVYGVKCETEFSQVVYGDKRSSLGHLGDNGSANGQNRFLCLSGTARWCLNKVVLPSVWSENMKWCGIESNYERDRVIKLFRLSRDYVGFVREINIERNDYIVNNVDLLCSVVNKDNDYIDDEYVPVGRVSVLVIADNCDNNVIYLGITKNTNGDLTNNTNVDMIYDKVIVGGNPRYYYYFGTIEKINFYGYYKKDSHMLCINKIEQCYVKKRLIFDDGG